MEFIINNLEYIVGIAGGLGIGIFMMTLKKDPSDNDMTQRVIKLKRYNDSVNRRSKSVM